MGLAEIGPYLSGRVVAVKILVFLFLFFLVILNNEITKLSFGFVLNYFAFGNNSSSHYDTLVVKIKTVCGELEGIFGGTHRKPHGAFFYFLLRFFAGKRLIKLFQQSVIASALLFGHFM